MKMAFRGLLLGAVAGLVLGCGENKSPPGGPGAKPGMKPGTTTGTTTGGTTTGGTTGTNTRPGDTTGTGTHGTSSKPEDTFKITVPSGTTSINQGESKTITIGIDRAKNFDQDVALQFSEMPKGVTMTPASGSIPASEKNTKVTLMASPDAALGEHTVTVTASPKSGAKTTATFTIKVNKAS